MYSCRICGEDDQDWWCRDYIFGTICQECRIKYTTRLMEVTKEACNAEIEKIKKECNDD
jgi:hypothetical protein